MNGNFAFRLASLLTMTLVVACGQDEQKYRERAQVERITALIDAQRYESVIRWYEGDTASADSRADYERYYALAKLGQGGFDPINVIPNILGVQTFRSPQRAKLFGNCKNIKLRSFDKPEMRCLVVRLINQLPSVDNPSLIEGEQILAKMAREKTISDSDYTLLMILETSIVLKRIGNVLESYLYLGDNLTEEQLVFYYSQIQKAATASDSWIETMAKSPEDVSKRLTGLHGTSIIKSINGKTKFIKETGIPYVLENIRVENRDSAAMLSRVFFTQVIDSTLRDYFLVE